MIRFQGDNSLIYFPGRQVIMEEVRQLKLIRPGVNDERIVMEVGCLKVETIDICLFPYIEDEDQSQPRFRWGQHLLVGSNYDSVFDDRIIIVFGTEGCLNSFVTTGKNQGWSSHDAGNERGLVWSMSSAQDFDYKRLLARWEELGKPTDVHASELLGVPRPRRSLRTMQPL